MINSLRTLLGGGILEQDIPAIEMTPLKRRG
jgi:hypothetical protein